MRDTHRVCPKHPEHKTAYRESPRGYAYQPCPECMKASIGPPDFPYFIPWSSGYIVEPDGTHTYDYTPAPGPEETTP